MSSRRPSSRRTRSEQQKALRQTVVFGLLAILLLAIFIFGALPLITRLGTGGGLTLNSNQDTIPPQVPTISPPATATNSAQIALSGFTEADAEVVLVVNGGETQRITANEDGEFELTAELAEGENTVSLYSVDEAGNESAATQNYPVEFDNTIPTLELTGIEDGQEIVGRVNQSVTLSGTTEPLSTIYVNGRLIRANGEGTFQTRYQLQEGENLITIEVIDPAGNTMTQELKIQFKL